jgi:hypothetical protein
MESIQRLSAAAMIVVVLFWLTTIEGLQLSPFGICTAIFLALSWPALAASLPDLFRRPEVLWAAAAHVFLFSGPFLKEGLTADSIRSGVRILMMFWAMLSLAAYTASSSKNFRHSILVFTACLGLSQLWYAAEILMGQPFVSWRMRLYSTHYESFGESIEIFRTGFAPFLHQLGYQSCVIASVLVAVSLMHSRAVIRRLCLIAATLMIAVMMTTAMRSPLLAVVLAAIVCILVVSGRLPVGFAAGSFAAVCVASWVIYTSVNWLTPADSLNIADKVDLQGAGADIVVRLLVQWNTFLLLFQHPLGLTDQQYFEGAFWIIFSDSRRTQIGAMSVHNGYLGASITYGLAFLLVCVGFLFSFTRAVLSALRTLRGQVTLNSEDVLRIAVLCSALGLFFPQAMLHNASIMTQEPTSMLTFGLSVGVFLGLRKTVAMEPRAKLRQHWHTVRTA